MITKWVSSNLETQDQLEIDDQVCAQCGAPYDFRDGKVVLICEVCVHHKKGIFDVKSIGQCQEPSR